MLRDADTGEIEQVDGNINFEHNEDFTEVTLKPVDGQASNKYTLIINKLSATTGKYITEDQAQFKAILQKEDEDGKIVYQDTIEDIYTNSKGKAIVDKLDLPDETGDYKLIITEEKAPEGYQKLENPIELNVKFEKDSKGQIIIASATEEYDYVSLSKVNKQLIGVNIENKVDEKIEDDEYSLDITKVDAETGEPIEAMAIFKVTLPDENHTSVYTETSETLL